MLSALAVQHDAFEEISAMIRRRGALVALEHLRSSLQKPPEGEQGELKAAFFARLIPYAGGEGPQTAAAALRLSKDLLASTGIHPWVRFQLVAGLAGLPSTKLGCGSDEDGSNFFYSFHTASSRAMIPGPETEAYQGPLAPASKADPEVQAVLQRALSDESDHVRRVAASAMGTLPLNASPDDVARAARADPSFLVRQEATKALANLQSPGAAAILEQAAFGDPSPYVKAAALRARSQLGEYDERAASFMQAAGSVVGEQERPAFADAAFDFMKRDPRAQDLRPTLVNMLATHGNEASFVRTCMRRATEQGLMEYSPVFEAIRVSLPEGSLRNELTDSLRKIEHGPESAAGLEKVRAASEQVNTLWSQLRTPGGTDAERQELIKKINMLMWDIHRLKEEPPK